MAEKFVSQKLQNYIFMLAMILILGIIIFKMFKGS
jgi:hypothetical protein